MEANGPQDQQEPRVVEDNAATSAIANDNADEQARRSSDEKVVFTKNGASTTERDSHIKDETAQAESSAPYTNVVADDEKSAQEKSTALTEELIESTAPDSIATDKYDTEGIQEEYEYAVKEHMPLTPKHESSHKTYDQQTTTATQSTEAITNDTAKNSFRQEITSDNVTSSFVQNYLENIYSENDDSNDLKEALSATEVASNVELDWTLRGSFLNLFTVLPTIDEVSSTASISSKTRSELTDDTGRFVRPVTFEKFVEPEDPSFEEEYEDAEEEYIEDVIEEVAEDEIAEIEDLLDDDDMELLAKIENNLEELDPKRFSIEDEEAIVMGTFMSKGKTQIAFSEFDFEANVYNEEGRLIRINTEEFLDDLIVKVVNASEFKDPRQILRASLDKKKLMAELEEALKPMEVEQRMRYFLNRKMVEYFKRKRTYRAITEDPPEFILMNVHKYNESLRNLDSAMGKEQQMKDHVAARMENLVNQLTQWDERVKGKVNEFEELVTETLIRESSLEVKEDKKAAAEILRRYSNAIKSLLRRLSDMRVELAQERLRLIKTQHTFATFEQKLEKIQDLGEGLKLTEYENLRTEIMALSKKMEERNSELGKVRYRCHIDLHIRAHMKEKIQSMRNEVVVQKLSYQALHGQRQQARHNLYALKLKRSRLRKEIEELSFQGGLVDKPALMLDYDQTEELVDSQKKTIKELREKYRELLTKVEQMEERCREKGIALPQN